MYCMNCGKEISNESKFCQYCGKAVRNCTQKPETLNTKQFVYNSTFTYNSTSVSEINQWFLKRRIILKNVQINTMFKSSLFHPELGIADMLLKYEIPEIPGKGYYYHLEFFSKMRALRSSVSEVRQMLNNFESNPDIIPVWSNIYHMIYNAYFATGFVIYRKKSE